jgi:uncharacterized membrane protein (UPF0127 family)
LSRRRFAISGCLAVLAACGTRPATNESPPAPAPSTAQSGLDLVRLTVRSGPRAHPFTVEVARTAAQQERGLMHRRALGANEGMLFPFDPPRPASFWMRNTLIPLDLIFIRPDGSIARIATGVPESEAQIMVDAPLTAVLEIPGGRAAQLGIAPGDRVSWTD